MTLMLLSPLDPVAAQIARVLKPGGIFAAVVPNRFRTDGLYASAQALVRDFARAATPGAPSPVTFDRRFCSKEGFEALFVHGNGFRGRVESEDFELVFTTNPAQSWEMFARSYSVSALAPEARDRLRQALEELVSKETRPDGTVTFEIPMRRITAAK